LPATRLRRDRHDPVNRPRRDRWALTGQGSFDSLDCLRMAWLDGKGIASPPLTGVGRTSAGCRTVPDTSTRAGAVEQPGSSGGAAGRNHTRPGPQLGGSGWGTTAPRTRRRCRGGRETRSRALRALRSRPLVARRALRKDRVPPARFVARPGATVHASALEATVRRDCFRRTDSPEARRPDRGWPPDCSRTLA
jgi:hypothetical protein